MPKITIKTGGIPLVKLKNNTPSIQVPAGSVADTKAKIWAEGTDEQVQALGGQHSAKGWATENESVVTKPAIYDLPNIGKVGVVYVIENENACYRWDEIGNKYYCVGRDYTNIEDINGGSANE